MHACDSGQDVDITQQSFPTLSSCQPLAHGVSGRRRAGTAARAAVPERQADAEARLVEGDLLVAADLVGDLLPGGGDGVGAFLGRGVLAGVDLGELVLGDRVVLEDAGDAGLDRGVRVVVAVEVRAEVVLDVGAVVAGGLPLVVVEMRVAVGLEAGGIGRPSRARGPCRRDAPPPTRRPSSSSRRNRRSPSRRRPSRCRPCSARSSGREASVSQALVLVL